MNRILIVFIIMLAVSTRLVAHPYNFTPVLAFSLLAGVYSKNKFGILVPLSIWLISDYFLGSYSYISYLSILVVYLIGYYFINNYKMKNIILGSIVGSFMFFLISNFLVWCGDLGSYIPGNLNSYEDNFAGIFKCYIRGLPFFRSSLLSTILFSGIIHTAYLLLNERFAIFQSNK